MKYWFLTICTTQDPQSAQHLHPGRLSYNRFINSSEEPFILPNLELCEGYAFLVKSTFFEKSAP